MMKLDNLKPAWQQLKVLNSMQAIDREDILQIIEQGEVLATGRLRRFLTSSVMVIVLIVCCQGG